MLALSKRSACLVVVTLLESSFLSVAVHYFGSTSPVTLWDNLEIGDLDSDFLQLRSDGFNTIILLLPWTAFSPRLVPNTSWDEDLFKKLHVVLRRAERNQLRVVGRVGYAWSLNNDQHMSSHQRCEALLTGTMPVWKSWTSFLARLNSVFRQHPKAYASSFITWEDFACPIHDWMYRPGPERLRLASASYFQWYLRSRCGDEVDEEGALKCRFVGSLLDDSAVPYRSFDDIPVPALRGIPEVQRFWVDYVNVLWRTLLQRSRSHLPSLSLEVRIDAEAIHKRDGSFMMWADNDLFADDMAVAPRAMYWAPFMHAPNNGSSITAAKALKSLWDTLMTATKNHRNINIFVDQFNCGCILIARRRSRTNVVDHTPEFSVNSNIEPEQLNVFIEKSAEVLQDLTVGYGLWAYRNYRKSWIYNGHFSKGYDGWTIKAEGCRYSSCTSIQQVMGQSKLIVDASNGTLEVTQHLSQQGGCSMPHIMLCADIDPLHSTHATSRLSTIRKFRGQRVSTSRITSARADKDILANPQSSLTLAPHAMATVKLEVEWGGKGMKVAVVGRGKPTCVMLPFTESSDLTLRFSAGGAALDNLHFYCHLHKLDIYGSGNKALGHRDSIVKLNSLLPDNSCLPSPAK